ncbi:hypothetical protein ACKFKG_21920 [Phormidesmis sp. 146-35]
MTQRQTTETAIDLEAIGHDAVLTDEPDANDEIDQIFILFRKLPRWRQLAVLERMQVFLESDDGPEPSFHGDLSELPARGRFE